MKSAFVQAGDVQLQYYEEGNGTGKRWCWCTGTHRRRYSGNTQLKPWLHPGSTGLSPSTTGEQEIPTAPSPEDDYTVQNFANDLYNAVSALGLNDFILVGHSMGGATVTQFAVNHQDMLRSLVLLNSAPLAGRVLADNWEEELRASFAAGGLTRGDMGYQAPAYNARLRGRSGTPSFCAIPSSGQSADGGRWERCACGSGWGRLQCRRW